MLGRVPRVSVTPFFLSNVLHNGERDSITEPIQEVEGRRVERSGLGRKNTSFPGPAKAKLYTLWSQTHESCIVIRGIERSMEISSCLDPFTTRHQLGAVSGVRYADLSPS